MQANTDSRLQLACRTELRSLLVDYQFLSKPVRKDRCSAFLALLEDSTHPDAELPRHASVSPPHSPPVPQVSSDSMKDLLQVLEEPVSTLWGVGPRVQEVMTKLGVASMADLLQHAPKGYLDLRHPSEVSRESLGQMVLIKAHLLAVMEIRRKVLLVKATARDPGGRVLHLVWFNNRYVRERLQAGHDYDFYGRLENSFDGVQLTQPAFEESGTPAAQLHMNRIVPLYHLTSGITQKGLRAHMWRATGRIPTAAAEYLPQEVASRFRLPDLTWAYRSLHFPTDESEAEEARSRFAFDSLFLFELRVLMRRRAEHDVPGTPFDLPAGTVERYAEALPFIPTASQSRGHARHRGRCPQTKADASLAPRRRRFRKDGRGWVCSVCCQAGGISRALSSAPPRSLRCRRAVSSKDFLHLWECESQH